MGSTTCDFEFKRAASDQQIDKQKFRFTDSFSQLRIEYPSLPESTRHTLPVETATKVETPKHVIIAFQKDKKNQLYKEMSKFNDISLRSVHVYLNSDRYPYSDLTLDFAKNKYTTLYDMYANFRENYYGNKPNKALFTLQEYKHNAPIAHIDCSRQKESLQPVQ